MSLLNRPDEIRPSIFSTIHRSLVTISGLIFLVGVLYWTVYPGDDPYRCRALFDTGRWIDPPNEHGDRLPFAQWQPDGCLMNNYTSEDIRQCIDGRHLVFSVDSTIRQVAYAVGRIVDRNAAKKHEHDMPRRVVMRLQYRGINITYVPDPFLHLSGTWEPYKLPSEGKPSYSSNLTVLTEEFDLFMKEQDQPVSIDKQSGAALMILGAGPWFAYGLQGSDRDMWMERYTSSITNVSEYLGHKKSDIFTTPFDSVDGRGNQVLFVPPSGPCLLKQSALDSGESFRKAEEIINYQNWLHATSDDLSFNLAWALPATVAGQNKTFIDPLYTGWHYVARVSEERANILLNFRCNAKLDRIRQNPTRGNCCTDYGKKPAVQQFLVGSGIIFLIICLAVEIFNIATHSSTSYVPFVNMKAGGALVFPLLMVYYADRTQLMAKGGKVWEFQSLVAFCVPLVIIGLVTIRKIPSPPPKSDTDDTEKEQCILSDHQMDEWKGWMIIIIVAVHWVNGDISVSLRVLTEVLMSSYIFMVGYEHTTNFLVNKNLSLTYGIRVLLRFNLFTCLLCHFANTTYLNYVYIPLLNLYFCVVWATMAVGPKQINDTQLTLTKICASATILTCIAKLTPVFSWSFQLLGAVFNTRWDFNMWKYHVEQDLYIVYVGMLLAVANHTTKERTHPLLRYTLAIAGVVALVASWSIWTQMGLRSDTYVAFYSLVSCLPILTYVALRNVSSTFRNFHSRALAWVGRRHLEIYVLHIHIFLAGDGHGVLLTGIFTGDGSLLGDRWRDILIIAPIFLWVSACAAFGTNNMIEMMIPIPSQKTEDDAYISLTNYEDNDKNNENKDEEEESDLEVDFDNLPPAPDSGAQKYLKIMSIFEYINPAASTREFISSLNSAYVFIILLLLAAWGLNLLTPIPASANIPDGKTSAWHDKDT